MYLLIFEDGTIYKATEITSDDKENCSDGILSIVNLDSLEELTIVDGEELWEPVNEWNNG